MIEFIQTIVALIVTLSILVTFHEFGHYYVARLCGVHVLRFSLGFGKPLFIWRSRPPGTSRSSSRDTVDGPASVKSTSEASLGGTEFVVAAIPLGGYVKMLDEREGTVPADQLHLAFNKKTVWQRIAIVAAGPLANFLLAILAYWLLFAAGVTGLAPILGDIEPESPAGKAGLRAGQEIVAVDGNPTPTWTHVNQWLLSHLGDTGSIQVTTIESTDTEKTREHHIDIANWLADADMPSPARDLGLVLRYPSVPAVVGGLVDEGRAKAAGLAVGDKIIVANGDPVADWNRLVKLIQSSPEEPIRLQVLRPGNAADQPDISLTLDLIPESRDRDGKAVGFIGVSVAPFPTQMLREISWPVYSAWIPALEKTWQVTVFTFESIGKMIVGAVSPRHLSGPITIARLANDTAEAGLESFIGFIALLSISLGVLNLLPIPILDGGHLLYYLVELVSGKPVPESVQAWGLQIGLFLIVSLMILAFYNDLIRL